MSTESTPSTPTTKKSQKKSPVSKSVKAGLVFPVGRLRSKLRTKSTFRISQTSAVYAAAVLEYIALEIIELAGDHAKRLGVKTITPEHVQFVFKTDECFVELAPTEMALSTSRSFEDATIAIRKERSAKRKLNQAKKEKKEKK